MTEWNIYTVGDIEFMHNVFNAVAMLMNSGMFSDLFRIGALLGVIGIVISSAISAGKTISFQNMAVCIVMYMLFFQVSARVNIEDVTSGRFRAVDNVPAGLAASASIISTVGYSITEKMEQAFSTPSMTEYGALDPLVALSTLYDSMKNPMRWFAANEKPRIDFARSVQNYMKTCVMNDIARGAKTYSTLYRGTDGVQGLRSNDNFQRVVLYDGNMVGWDPSTPDMKDISSQYTCAEAFDKLTLQQSQASSMLLKAYQRSYAALGRGCPAGKTCTQSTKIQEVMSFYNMSGTTMRDFQMTMIMYPYLRDVPRYGYEAAFRGAAAVTRTQTQTQQAFQWASSGASFLSWMAAFMPIFQGLIYALTPFMAFLFGLGIMGIRLVMKYFLVIIWTQTWMPLAAIVNMYILVQTQTNLSAIFTEPGQLSFDKLYILLYETQKSIGLAGNLYAMIPALGGFIVWGSSVGFNSLSNSAAAPHAADTKQMAPDISNAPAISNRSADINYDRANGTVLGGASSALPKFDMKQSASTNLASAQQNLASSSKEVSATRSRMFSDIASNMESGRQTQTYSDAVSAGFNALSSADQQAVHDVAKRNNMSDTQALIAMQTGQASLSGSAGGGGGSGKVELGASMSRSEMASEGKSNAVSDTYGSADSSASRDSVSAQESRILNQSAQSTYDHLNSAGQTSANSQAFSEAYKQQETAQRTYQSASQFAMSSSLGQTMTSSQISQGINNSPEAQAVLTQELAAHPEMQQTIAENTARLSQLGMTEHDAGTFAKFQAATQLGVAGDIAAKAGFVTGGQGQPEVNPNAANEYHSIGAGAGQASGQISGISGSVNGGANSLRSSANEGINNSWKESSRETAVKQLGEASGQNHNDVDQTSGQNNHQIAVQKGDAASIDFERNGSMRMTGVSGGIQAIADKVSNAFKPSGPTYETNKSIATEAASSAQFITPDKNDAKEAIAEYYAQTKSGQSSDSLDHLHAQTVMQVQLATGGYVTESGMVKGGNEKLANGIANAIQDSGRDQHRNDAQLVTKSVESLMTERDGTTVSTYGAAGTDFSGMRENYDRKLNTGETTPGGSGRDNNNGEPDVMIVTPKDK